MKKIFAALALAMLVVPSCEVADIPYPDNDTSNQGVEVAITVSSLQPGTRAIKNNWSDGDIINVYLDNPPSYTPDFTLTYNGSGWAASELSSDVIARLKSDGTGKLHGFWEGSNSCVTEWAHRREFIRFPDDYKAGTTGVFDQLVADFSDVSYTYSEGKLKAEIKTWHFYSDIQIVVSGIDYEEGRYTLYSDQIKNFSMISTKDNCTVYYTGAGSSEGRIAGIPNEDGVAFVGAIESVNWLKYTFYLLDNNTGAVYTFAKNVTLDPGDQTKVIAVNIPFSKFDLSN